MDSYGSSKYQEHSRLSYLLPRTTKKNNVTQIINVVNQTAVKWVSEELFVTGSSSAPRINLWNIEGSIQSKFLYEVQKGKEAAASQVNRLEILRDRRLIVAGCEDTVVRLFDITTGKIIKKLETKGAVGALLGWEWNLLAGDHKGCISNWDVRTFRLI
jgi:WD40 repeat protein